MGKAVRRKRNKTQIIETLVSAEFQAHIEQTFSGVTPIPIEEVIPKLIQKAREGVSDYWMGMRILQEEFRVGYQSDGNCYTMSIVNGVGYCYDFSKGNTSMPVRCIPFPPSRISVYSKL